MCTLHNGDCLEYMKSLQPASVDCVFADPPYGTNIAEWDSVFPTDWIFEASRIARVCIAVTPGTNNILKLPERAGEFEYRWTLSPILEGSPTHGKMGFSSWIPVMVYAKVNVSIYKAQADAGRIKSPPERIDHPSPKPLSVMKWIINHLPDCQSFLDPFMGSGTTGVACVKMQRDFIGIEINQKYFALAEKRIKEAALQHHLFTPSNNRLHMDAGDSPRQPSQSTLEGFTPAEQGTTPSPRQ